MSAMLGVPVFNYEIQELNSSPFDLLWNAMENTYIVVVINWYSDNSCGFSDIGSFSVLTNFYLNLYNGSFIEVTVLKDPYTWESTYN
jgi:hypothetical protein